MTVSRDYIIIRVSWQAPKDLSWSGQSLVFLALRGGDVWTCLRVDQCTKEIWRVIVFPLVMVIDPVYPHALMFHLLCIFLSQIWALLTACNIYWIHAVWSHYTRQKGFSNWYSYWTDIANQPWPSTLMVEIVQWKVQLESRFERIWWVSMSGLL